MRKLLIALMAVVICGVCNAQVGNNHQGAYVPLRGRKTHNDVQFKAVIIRQQNGDYVISDKCYEPDLMNRKGGWETGQRTHTIQ